MQLIETTSTDARFVVLCDELDADLNKQNGEVLQKLYKQYNTLEKIQNVVLALQDETPVACAALKEYAPGTAEVKRVYTKPLCRGQGVYPPCAGNRAEHAARPTAISPPWVSPNTKLRPLRNPARFVLYGKAVIKSSPAVFCRRGCLLFSFYMASQCVIWLRPFCFEQYSALSAFFVICSTFSLLLTSARPTLMVTR